MSDSDLSRYIQGRSVLVIPMHPSDTDFSECEFRFGEYYCHARSHRFSRTDHGQAAFEVTASGQPEAIRSFGRAIGMEWITPYTAELKKHFAFVPASWTAAQVVEVFKKHMGLANVADLLTNT